MKQAALQAHRELEATKAAFAEVRKSLSERLFLSDKKDMALREQLYLQYRCLDEVEHALQVAYSDGLIEDAKDRALNAAR